ncbi:hypothetical protein IE53DRAFT_121388 [Violaceomyces palustris]|uniref:Uncharacterized protein n=1 Tax=Violaceomyces palustris TaxID=1673888 RepID=A0ACD0P6E8_9BASI|nr:hypothetical protein IE53DRAFT_121388 [Violaceomyces palustris]
MPFSVSSSSFDELRCQTPSHSLSGSLHRAERSSAMDRRDDNDDIKSMEKRAKRREQNRNAQRRFRGRQEEYTMKLELEVARLKKIIAEHEATHQNMEELVRKLLAQKDELQRNLDRSFSGTNPSLPSDNRVLTSPNPIQNCASMKDGHQGFDHTSKHVKPGGSSFHVGFRQRSTSNASNQAQAKLRTGEAGPHMNHIESFDPQRLRGQSQQDLQQRSSLMSRPHSSGSENQRGLRPHPQDGLDGYSFPSDNSTVVLGFQSYNMMPSVGINQSTGETLGRSASNPTIQSSGMTGSAELARFPVNRSQPSNMPVVQQPGLAKVFLGEGSNRYGIPTDSLASHTSESYHTSPST